MSGASGGPGRHKYYKCANRQTARARCEEAVAHRREHLETAVLEYLGQYTDPAMVRELLDAQEQETDTRDESELARVTARRVRQVLDGGLTARFRRQRLTGTPARFPVASVRG